MMNASLSTFLLARSSLPPPTYISTILRQCDLRLSALAHLFSSKPPFLKAVTAARVALLSSAPSTWPAHVSFFHASALAHVSSLPRGSREAPQLDALLSTLAVLGVGAGEAAASAGACTAPLVSALDIGALLREEAAGIHALAVEKFGACPTLEVVVENAPAPLRCVAAPALLRHGLAELLKNAIAAQVGAYTAAGVEDAPPVVVSAVGGADGADLHLAVLNYAGPHAPPPAAVLLEEGPFPFFAAPVRADAEREPTYHYSRDFGVPFSGAGVGLPRTFAYGKLHGGGLALRAVAGGGVEAQLTVRRDGGGEGAAPHPLLLGSAPAPVFLKSLEF